MDANTSTRNNLQRSELEARNNSQQLKNSEFTSDDFDSLTHAELLDSFGSNKKFKKLADNFKADTLNLFNPKAKSVSDYSGIYVRQYYGNKKSFQAQVRVYTHDGKRTHKNFSAPTRAKAVRLAINYQDTLKEKDCFDGKKYVLPAPTDKIYIPTVTECFLEYIKLRKLKNDGESSIKQYETRANTRLINPDPKMYTFGDMRITDVRVRHIHKMMESMQELGYATNTINIWRSDLSSAFRHSVSLEQLKRNVFEGVDGYNNDTEEQDYLSAKEMQAVLTNSIGTELELFLFTMAFTGMRFSEVCGLSVKDIDFETGAVSVSQQLLSGKIKQPKTKNATRTIEFAPESPYMKKLKIRVDELKELFGTEFNQDMLILSTKPDGKWWSSNYWRLKFKVFKKDLPFKVDNPNWTFHSLRHTWNTIAFSKGHDAGKISRATGHSNAGFTLSTYAHHVENESVAITTDIEKEIYPVGAKA